MLLRRLIENARTGEWSTVIVELFIVVGGVFIGIQAANWNDSRLEEERGREVTERLIADLYQDLRAVNELVSYYDAVLLSGENTVERLNAPEIDDLKAFVVDAYRATEYAHRGQTRATYDEIVATGSFSLITESARRAGIVRYFGQDNSAQLRAAVRGSPYRHRVRRLLPHDVQASIRANCSDVRDARGEITGFEVDCNLGLPDFRIERAASALLSDAELLLDLRLHFSILNSQLPNLRAQVNNIQSTIEALESDLQQ